MNTIQNLFQQAQLAEAAYANFWDSNFNSLISNSEDVKKALIATTFSDTQATEFIKHWRVISQYTATGLFGQTWLGSGFSATVF